MKQRSANYEISFLGLKFTRLRTALSIAIFITTALIIDRFWHRLCHE